MRSSEFLPSPVRPWETQIRTDKAQENRATLSGISPLTGTADEARSVNTLFDSVFLRTVGPAR